jgi:hypothetical protein
MRNAGGPNARAPEYAEERMRGTTKGTPTPVRRGVTAHPLSRGAATGRPLIGGPGRPRLRVVALILLAPAMVRAQGSKPAPTSPPQQDSVHAGHAGMQECGAEVMGVDQATSVHVFEALPNGGVIELQRASDDSVGMLTIRRHLRGIAQAFSAGDFGAPTYIHMTSVPGARIMAERRSVIRYDYRDLPRGGALRISTSDAIARKAIWEFIAYQRNEHLAGERP